MPTDHDVRPGLLGTLLDRDLTVMATPAVLRLLYTLALACITGVNLVLFWIGWGLTGGGPFWSTWGWLIVAGAPLLWLAELVIARLAVEYLVVQHRISAELTAIRQALTDRSPT